MSWEELRNEEVDYQLLLLEQELRLRPLTLDLEARADLFDVAVGGLLNHVNQDREVARPELNGEIFRDALWVLLAARAWIDGKDLTESVDLLADQIDWEGRFWKRSSETAGPETKQWPCWGVSPGFPATISSCRQRCGSMPCTRGHGG